MMRTDGELVAAIIGGDTNSFEVLIKRYERLVFGIVYNYLGHRGEVEDLAQDVFLKAFKALKSYDPTRPFKAWIGRIAANTCLDEIRRAKHRKTQLFSDLADDEREGTDEFFSRFQAGATISHYEAERLFGLLQSLLAELGEKDRMAFVLREIQALEYSEIAEAMDTTELAVRIRVSRSRKQLMKMLAAQLAEQGVR